VIGEQASEGAMTTITVRLNGSSNRPASGRPRPSEAAAGSDVEVRPSVTRHDAGHSG
jgi:hypothetical protein